MLGGRVLFLFGLFFIYAFSLCFRNAAGNQCCYGTSGLLVFTADTYFGSTPDKTHDWGAAPYGKPGYVPLLSHWVLDIVQLHYCCVWDDYNSCDYYMELRPTTDCTGYNPPVPGWIIIMASRSSCCSKLFYKVSISIIGCLEYGFHEEFWLKIKTFNLH